MTAGAPWRLAGATVVGSAHTAAGTQGQDAHAVRVRPDGVLVAAVADGAGSAPHSARGAAVAVAAAVGTLFDAAIDGGAGRADSAASALAGAMRAAGGAVIALARAEGLAPRDVACTLSCVVAAAEGALAAQIGDGLVVVVDEAGTLTPLSAPERGAYANETVFLTSPNAIDTAIESIQRLDGPVAAVALLTDGLLRLAMNMADRTPHAAFFHPLFRFVSQFSEATTEPTAEAIPDVDAGNGGAADRANAALTAFLDSARVRARTDDDLTLVLAARPASAAPP